MTLLDRDDRAIDDDDGDDPDTPGGPTAPGAGPHDPEAPARRPLGSAAVRRVIDALVVMSCAAFVFWQLHPSLILSDSTPAGGDMGAHVWALGFLRDSLLPDFQLAGWTADWYAGFPAFQFYMVVPFLVMVVLNAGFLDAHNAVVATVLWGLVVAAVVGVVGRAALGPLANRARTRQIRRFLVVAGIVIVGAVSFPFGAAFKLVTVLGVVTMPASAYLFGRLSRFPFPTPALMAVGVLAFVFDRNFTIYGGNIASTLAGEFAFSISLSLALAYLGVLVHGMRTGTHRATGAVLLALTGLCHIIPAFFALAATAVIVASHLVSEALVRRSAARTARVVATAEEDAGTDDADVTVSDPVTDPAPGSIPGVVGAARVWWLLSTGVVAALLAAFWVLPFFLRRTYLNDMGWKKIAVRAPGEGIWDWFSTDVWSELIPSPPANPWNLVPFAAAALVGAILSIVFRNRIGTSLVLLGLGLAAAFVWVPQGRLWNARLLPFWFLVIYLLAAVGVGEVTRASAELAAGARARSPLDPLIVIGVLVVARLGIDVVGVPGESVIGPVLWVAVGGGVVWFVMVHVMGALGIDPRRAVLGVAPLSLLVLAGLLGAQLRNLWVFGDANADGSYSVLGVADVTERNFVTDWSRWNYSGYENKTLWPEYRAIVSTMADVGRTNGCGMSLWEYKKELNDYGTPMALMLLPHWTEGCIGSMEGLYFEASSTTPFHFLLQSELSVAPSRAQRDMPYRSFDIERGVEHLQLMGVRYYLASTLEAQEAARGHDDLALVAESGPWQVFEVADAPQVESLSFEPAVTSEGQAQDEWLCLAQDANDVCSGPALDWWQDSTQWDVALAAHGPAGWQRVAYGEVPERRPITPTQVSDLSTDRDRISFRVDRPGVPVLVKESYFPNWEVTGAEGPYRVAPNLMVVVPTTTEVTLRYRRTPVDWASSALTVLGLGLLVLLARRRQVAVPALVDAPGAADPDMARPWVPPAQRTHDDDVASDDYEAFEAWTGVDEPGAEPRSRPVRAPRWGAVEQAGGDDTEADEHPVGRRRGPDEDPRDSGFVAPVIVRGNHESGHDRLPPANEPSAGDEDDDQPSP